MWGAIIKSERKRWGHGFLRWFALLAVALHVFTIEGHVHVPDFAGQAAAHKAASQQAAAHIQHTLSNPSDPIPCVFCQTMAAGGAGIAPNAPLLVLWLGAAALIAALLGRRHVALQRLTIWRSRAPPPR